MDDHQTGQHLQGMLLVEASRQAFLAVTEAFILPWGGEKAYFVFNSLTVEFSRFMFPVAACLNFRVRERDYSGKYPRFSVEIQIEQAGRQTAEVRCGYTVMPDQRIAEVEQALALQALDWQFSAVSDVLSADSSAESVMSKPLIAE